MLTLDVLFNYAYCNFYPSYLKENAAYLKPYNTNTLSLNISFFNESCEYRSYYNIIPTKLHSSYTFSSAVGVLIENGISWIYLLYSGCKLKLG